MRVGDLVKHEDKLGFVVDLYEAFCQVQFQDKQRWLYKDVCVVVVKNPDLKDVSSEEMVFSSSEYVESSEESKELSEELLIPKNKSCWLC